MAVGDCSLAVSSAQASIAGQSRKWPLGSASLAAAADRVFVGGDRPNLGHADLYALHEREGAIMGRGRGSATGRDAENRRRRRAFDTTVTDDSAIDAAARIGSSSSPVNG
jgi:hypothetical protein